MNLAILCFTFIVKSLFLNIQSSVCKGLSILFSKLSVPNKAIHKTRIVFIEYQYLAKDIPLCAYIRREI